MLRQLFAIYKFFAAFCLVVSYNNAHAAKLTLYSGGFDRNFYIAADHDQMTISGLYDDGGCRFAFFGPLIPIEKDFDSDPDEQYRVDSWDIMNPNQRFTTKIYSKAINGFLDQITLVLSSDHPNIPRRCHERNTLDRRYSVGNSYYAVAMVRRSFVRLLEMKDGSTPTRWLTSRKRGPRAGTVVWLDDSYKNAVLPVGIVNVQWYESEGPTRGGLMRLQDLYPFPKDLRPLIR